MAPIFSPGNEMIDISPPMFLIISGSQVSGVIWEHSHYHGHKRSSHTFAFKQTEATAAIMYITQYRLYYERIVPIRLKGHCRAFRSVQMNSQHTIYAYNCNV